MVGAISDIQLWCLRLPIELRWPLQGQFKEAHTSKQLSRIVHSQVVYRVPYQQGEIQSLKLQLTEMQEQLVEARSSNDEMKGMILQLLNATKTTTDVPKENDADTIEGGCESL